MMIYRFQIIIIFWLKVLGFTQSVCVDRGTMLKYLGNNAPEWQDHLRKYTKPPWMYATKLRKHIVYIEMHKATSFVIQALSHIQILSISRLNYVVD